MTATDNPIIYTHPSRPEWGYCVAGRTEGENRHYLFAKGVVRRITRDFWDNLKPASLAPDKAREIDAEIRRSHEPKAPAPKGSRASRAPKEPASAKAPKMSFDEQVRQFLVLFPSGFQDERFVIEERGLPDAGTKKGYKEHAIERAKRDLAKKDLDAKIAAGKFDEVFATVRGVLESASNMLSPMGELIPFKAIPAERHEALARSVRDLLHGTGDFTPRFDAFVTALDIPGRKPTWSLATILTALFAPTEHFFIRPTIADEQARIAAVEPARKSLPEGAAYEIFVKMARDLEDRLRKAGLAPRDLMDVYSFSYTTLHEKSLKVALGKIKPKAEAAPG